jgi:antitoxin HicB
VKVVADATPLIVCTKICLLDLLSKLHPGCGWPAPVGANKRTSSKCGSGRMLVVKYRVYLQQDEDRMFVATCPTLPGCVSQGRTRAEATENIREAIEGYLISLRKHGDPVPPSILEEVIEVSGG